MAVPEVEPSVFSIAYGSGWYFGIWENYDHNGDGVPLPDRITFYRGDVGSLVASIPLMVAYDKAANSISFEAVGTLRSIVSKGAYVPVLAEASLTVDKGIGTGALIISSYEDGIKGATLFTIQDVRMNRTVLHIP